MPLPLLPLVIGGAGAALLFLGGKEKAAAQPAADGVSATPTQATTGGDNGGATAPSHADLVNTTAQTGAAGTPSAETDSSAGSGGGGTSSVLSLGAEAEAEEAAYEASSPMFDGGKTEYTQEAAKFDMQYADALSALGYQPGTLSSKAAADNFQKLYNPFGIW